MDGWMDGCRCGLCHCSRGCRGVYAVWYEYIDMFLLRRIRPALGKEREVDTLAEEKRILYNSCYVVVNYSDVMVSV